MSHTNNDNPQQRDISGEFGAQVTTAAPMSSMSQYGSRGRAKPMATQEAWSDSSDDDNDAVATPPQITKPKATPPRAQLAMDSSSDEEQPQQQRRPKKKKRGGRNKKSIPNKNDSRADNYHHNNQATKPEMPAEHKEAPRDEASDKPKLRSPICVVMGHVNSGKTKILDHIRCSAVQEKEANGITQQIGATYLSIDYIKERTARLSEQVRKLKYKVPGLLFIDTPGHAEFSNLRSRGSEMCDIAVLVVDLMEGLMPTTIESLKMLTARRSPFVVALNKIDRLSGWKADPDAPFRSTFEKQSKHTKFDFEKRVKEIKAQFAAQLLNAELYYKNKKPDTDISMVPTSAHTGEGIPDLLYLIVTLTKKFMSRRIKFKAHKSVCRVLEVKRTRGFGATIDVIVSNGTLMKSDEIVVCGMTGPIVTPIKALLLPHEAQEMRVRGEYAQVNEVSASVGVRIAAVEDLSSAVAGTPMFVVPRNLEKNSQERWETVERLKDEVQASFETFKKNFQQSGRGVFVQASTLGSLEALIGFLRDQKIPISGIGIGTISKKTVMRASTMLSHQPELAAIIAFNVKCSADAREMAAEMGVALLESEIIYEFAELFRVHKREYLKTSFLKRCDGRELGPSSAVFPVECRILSAFRENPLVLGVQVVRGSLRKNTPVVAKRWSGVGADRVPAPLYLGRVVKIMHNRNEVPMAQMGDQVSVQIGAKDEQPRMRVGREFLATDPICAEITRDSIDALKLHFEDELRQDSNLRQHLGQLKRYFQVK